MVFTYCTLYKLNFSLSDIHVYTLPASSSYLERFSWENKLLCDFLIRILASNKEFYCWVSYEEITCMIFKLLKLTEVILVVHFMVRSSMHKYLLTSKNRSFPKTWKPITIIYSTTPYTCTTNNLGRNPTVVVLQFFLHSHYMHLLPNLLLCWFITTAQVRVNPGCNLWK